MKLVNLSQFKIMTIKKITLYYGDESDQMKVLIRTKNQYINLYIDYTIKQEKSQYFLIKKLKYQKGIEKMNKKDEILDRSYIENLSKEEQFAFLEKELDLNNQVDDSKFEKELGDYWAELCRVHPKRMLDAKGVTPDIRLSALFFMLNRILENKIQIIEKKKL